MRIMHKKSIIFTGITSLLFLLSINAQAKIYKWIDANGQTHYSAQPPKPSKQKIKTVIFGNNISTELVMPPSWTYSKRDAAHIRAIHKKFGERKLTNFPLIDPWDFFKYMKVDGIRYESLLSFMDFNKDAALKELKEKLDYKPYPRKHGESRFTQFYQEYYLPEKFGFDKRKSHLSSLIISGQITRDEALKELHKPLYPDKGAMRRDLDYVLRKLEFSPSDWKAIMSAPPASHDDYPGYYTRLKQFRVVKKAVFNH